jgi:hypothetical protein
MEFAAGCIHAISIIRFGIPGFIRYTPLMGQIYWGDNCRYAGGSPAYKEKEITHENLEKNST